MRLADLPILDLRPRLSVTASASRRPRRGPVTGATLHYNGPSLPFAGDPQREINHIINVDVPNHQARIGADSLMYHFVILSDGAIYQTRNLELIAWHAAHQIPNESHLAIHLPLGGTQDTKARQWERTVQLLEALADTYRFPRSAVRGHKEWSATACPGPRLMPRLIAWREDRPAPDGGFFRIRRDVAQANVRQGPGTRFPIALDGKAVMWPGDTLDADAVVVGDVVGSEPRWAHRRDGVGFVHWSLLEAV